jgi:hypothetical protein
MSGLFPLSELVQGEPDLLKLDQKFSRPASDAQIEKTKKSLEAKSHKVTVVNTASEAVALLKNQIPEGATVYNAGSTTLSEIGFLDVLKTETKWKNLHAEILAEKDQAKAGELRRVAMGADYFLSSVSALSEEGDLVVADASGTRVGGFAFSAKNVLVVTGSNKIVPTHDDAVARTKEYVFPIESARARKAYGLPGSMLNFVLSINSGSPFAPGRIHIVIVKEALGF